MLSTETPSPVAGLLKQHMLHRFRSSYLRDRDAELLGEAAVADGASEADKLTAWYSLMETTGVIQPCIERFELFRTDASLLMVRTNASLLASMPYCAMTY
jgi:hypothetical protein